MRKLPTLLLSVSLTAAYKEGDHSAEIQACVDRFTEDAEWIPKEWAPVAGALKYVEYDWLKRMIMKSISKKAGGDTDTGHDYENTDWEKLDETIKSFLTKSLDLGPSDRSLSVTEKVVPS